MNRKLERSTASRLEGIVDFVTSVAFAVLAVISVSAQQATKPAHTASRAEWPHFAIRHRLATPQHIRYFIEPGPGPVERATFERLIRESASLWQGSGLVAFEQVDTAEASVVTIGWRDRDHGDCPHFYPAAGKLAHTGPRDGRYFVHINRDTAFTERGPGPGLFQTLLHEWGHVLGIGHSIDPRSAMYSAYDVTRISLGAADLAALRSLYGSTEANGTDAIAADDITFARIDGDARRKAIAPPLRDALPSWRRCFVADMTGDQRDELITWSDPLDADRGTMVYAFDDHLRLTKTYGPFPYFIDPALTPRVESSATGERYLIQYAPNGRYQAARLTPGDIMPVHPRSPRTPLILSGELADSEPDGVLDRLPKAPTLGIVESQYRGWRVVSQARLDGDPVSDVLITDGKEYRVLLLDRAGAIRKAGATWLARTALLADLDGDGRAELVTVAARF